MSCPKIRESNIISFLRPNFYRDIIARNARFITKIRVLLRNKKSITTRHFARDYFPRHRLSCQAEITSPSGRACEALEDERKNEREKREGRRGKGERSSRVSDSRMRLPISGVQQPRTRKNALCIAASTLRAAIIGSAIQFPSQREPTVTRGGLESSWRPPDLGILRHD